MKKLFYSILLFAGVCSIFAACSKAYTANPQSNANGVVNPLTPLTSGQFTWQSSGTAPMSATINGVPWVASSAGWSLNSNGANVITGITAGGTLVTLSLANVYGGTVYGMNYKNYEQFCEFADSADGVYNTYYSFNGNSGEVKILENDSVNITGLFYAEVIAPNGTITAINNGYFNINKY